ncbi:RING-H2 finger protein ATL78 [Linum grandiflorum]
MAARRLLFLNSLFNHRSPPSSSSTAANPPPVATAATETDTTFDANVVMVLAVLLCALIISLALNSIIRCAFIRLSRRRPPAGGQQLPATGIKKKALKTFPIVTFSSAGSNDVDDECVICLSEFAAGDRVKILPKCNHGFHVKCIDKWLGDHSSCPTCRHCLVDTCRKIVGGEGSSSSSDPSPAAPAAGGVVISMPPMEAEGPVREHRIVKSVFFWRKN